MSINPVPVPPITPAGIGGLLTILTALAAVVTALTGITTAPYILAAATAVAGVVTVVGILRGKGTLQHRLWVALDEVLILILQVLAVMPKTVTTFRKSVSARRLSTIKSNTI